MSVVAMHIDRAVVDTETIFWMSWDDAFGAAVGNEKKGRGGARERETERLRGG